MFLAELKRQEEAYTILENQLEDLDRPADIRI